MDLEWLNMVDLEWLKLVALALAPIAFIFTYVYLSDEYEKEPLKYLVITFILGASLAIPVIFLGDVLQTATGTDSHSSWGKLLIYAFFVVATTEEGMKYLVLRCYNYPHREFDEPYDGIMYGVAVSLGFAAIENVLYAIWAEEDPYGVVMLRMFTAVPAHAMFGVLMGFFVGQAKFMRKGSPFLMRMTGLGIAILFHGTYDYFLFLNSPFLSLVAFVALMLGLFLAWHAMKMHVAISPHREVSDDPPPPTP